MGLVAALLAAAADAGVLLLTPASRDEVVLRLDVRAERTPGLAANVDRLQYQHQFGAAERLLTDRLATDPRNADLLLQRAQLRIAQQNPRGALSDCVRAAPQLDALSATACQAQAMGALNQVASARLMIETALARSHGNSSVESWAQGIAAELAARDAAPAEAEAWHLAAIASAGAVHYPRIAYAEFLLQQRRPREVLQLLADTPDSTTVMQLRRRALEQRP